MSSSLAEVTQYVVDLFEANTQLGFEDVFYGDQDMIPRTPAIAIEPVSMNRELAGVGSGGITQNTITLSLFIYHCPLQSVEVTRRESDLLAESVQGVLHTDVTLGGLVIHGFCTASESGFAVRGGALLRAHRITWSGFSKTGLQP